MEYFTKIPNIIDCDFGTKIKYLNEYKEFLYEVWYQKITTIPTKDKLKIQKESLNAFYMAFSAMAKTVLRPNFDKHSRKIVDYQQLVENELESFRYSEANLALHCDAHDDELKSMVRNILYDKNELNDYLKSQIINFRNIYLSPQTNQNRFNSLKIGMKSECILLLSLAPNMNEKQSSEAIGYWFKELKEYFDPTREFKFKVYKETLKNEIVNHNPKHYFYFKYATAEKEHLLPYEKSFSSLCEKINLWSQIYETPQFYYRSDYLNFRNAINTHIKIYQEANLIPEELIYWLNKYTDNRFEKLEAYKHGAITTIPDEIIKIRKNYKKYLYQQLDEVMVVPPEKLTPEFKSDILKMVSVKAKFFCPKENYQEDLLDLTNYFYTLTEPQENQKSEIVPKKTEESIREL